MIELRVHFVVEQPMQWRPGDRPLIIRRPDGGVVGLFNRTVEGALVPLIGHTLITNRDPPAMHMIIDGVICYAIWFVTVDKTA